MHNAPSSLRSSFALRLATAATLACAPALCAHAQTLFQPVGQTSPSASIFTVNPKPFDLASYAGGPSDTDSSSSSSSSSTDTPDTLALGATPGDPGQPPPRRRYGRPRYNDSSHNPDGSSKYGFLAGAGFTLATGNTFHYLNTNYAFQVGAGRNFNKNFSLNLQFDWDNFGFNGRTIYNQYLVYGAEDAIDGQSHVWSFTLDPTYNFYTREGLGAYVVGGVGFFHKVATFTTPEVGYVDTGFGYEPVEENETVAHYTSNAPGFDGGLGLTYKPSRFSNTKLYAEARYVFVDNTQRYGLNATNATTYTGYNYYPANSNRTTYIPIKFGVRF